MEHNEGRSTPSDHDRKAVMLALARADGQFWESIAEATPHTAEVMYGEQADAMMLILAATKAAVREEERAAWSAWLDAEITLNQRPVTVKMIASSLRRGPRPFAHPDHPANADA